MKRLFLLIPVSLIFCCLVLAQTQQERRRIDEEKRESLRPSEALISPLSPSYSKTTKTYAGLIYFKDLLSRKVSYQSDIAQILVILLGVEEEYTDFNAQAQFLTAQGIIPPDEASRFNPHVPLRKGLSAYMFLKALDIKGGLWLRLFGVNERYALRELTYLEIIPPGNSNEIVSGKELIVTFINAVNYKVDQEKAFNSKDK
jgi:hypothetical protein